MSVDICVGRCFKTVMQRSTSGDVFLRVTLAYIQIYQNVIPPSGVFSNFSGRVLIEYHIIRILYFVV